MIEAHNFFDIEGVPFYQISKSGVIRRLEHRVLAKDGVYYTIKAMIRKSYIASTGYLYIEIKGVHYNIHRLVATTFIPNPENKRYVNHKDGNKLNNYIDNLEWSTPSENNLHAYTTGLKVGAHTGRFGAQHHRSIPVKKVDLNGDIIEKYESGALAARAHNIKNISPWIIRGMLFQKKFYWKYDR